MDTEFEQALRDRYASFDIRISMSEEAISVTIGIPNRGRTAKLPPPPPTPEAEDRELLLILEAPDGAQYATYDATDSEWTGATVELTDQTQLKFTKCTGAGLNIRSTGKGTTHPAQVFFVSSQITGTQLLGSVDVCLHAHVIASTLRESNANHVWLHLEGMSSITVSGSSRGFSVRQIIVGNSTPTSLIELENINIFALDPSRLPQDSINFRRFSPWLPRRTNGSIDRKDMLVMARDFPVAIGSDEQAGTIPRDTVLRRQAHWWRSFADTLLTGEVSGEVANAIQHIALDARRLAAPPRSSQRLLLEIFRWFGYGTRPGWPLVLWVLVAGAVATLLSGLACATSQFGCDVRPSGQWMESWVDVVFSPISFLRPIGSSSQIAETLEQVSDSWRWLASLALWSGRIIGSLSILASALAVRRQVKIESN